MRLFEPFTTDYFNTVPNKGTDYALTPVYSVSIGEVPQSGSVTVILVLLASTVVSSVSVRSPTSATLFPSFASSDTLLDIHSGSGNGGVSDEE